jgi:hypothetical protein
MPPSARARPGNAAAAASSSGGEGGGGASGGVRRRALRPRLRRGGGKSLTAAVALLCVAMWSCSPSSGSSSTGSGSGGITASAAASATVGSDIPVFIISLLLDEDAQERRSELVLELQDKVLVQQELITVVPAFDPSSMDYGRSSAVEAILLAGTGAAVATSAQQAQHVLAKVRRQQTANDTLPPAAGNDDARAVENERVAVAARALSHFRAMAGSIRQDMWPVLVLEDSVTVTPLVEGGGVRLLHELQGDLPESWEVLSLAGSSSSFAAYLLSEAGARKLVGAVWPGGVQAAIRGTRSGPFYFEGPEMLMVNSPASLFSLLSPPPPAETFFWSAQPLVSERPAALSASQLAADLSPPSPPAVSVLVHHIPGSGLEDVEVLIEVADGEDSCAAVGRACLELSMPDQECLRLLHELERMRVDNGHASQTHCPDSGYELYERLLECGRGGRGALGGF